MPSVDKRVAELVFDNKQFERGIATSMKSLDKLNEKLDMKEGGKGIEALQKQINTMSLAHLATSVDAISKRFTVMGMMGREVLENLVRDAYSAGKRIISALTVAPVKMGFNEYELKMTAVQTLLAGTGETLGRVNSKLNELNEYSDRTIYSFSDMTANIGKFTNAGVSLDDSVLALKGVANWAARSGAGANEASRAMYNMGQALGTGKVMIRDWMSIENANMATMEFKNQVIAVAEELGTLDKNHGITAENFRENLEKGFFSSEVLTKVLGMYGDETTEIGKKAMEAATEVKTLTMMWDTMKESAQSGWAQSWELIIGDFEEAKALFTGMSKALSAPLDAMSKARNDLLQGWKDLGGREDLIRTFSALWLSVTKISGKIKEAFQEVFGVTTSSGLKSMTEGIKNFFETIYYWLSGGKDGKGVNRLEQIGKVFKGVFSIFNIGVQIVKAIAGAFGKLFGAIGGGDIFGSILDFFAGIGDSISNFANNLKNTKFFENFFTNIISGLGPVLERVKAFGTLIWNTITDLFTGGDEVADPNRQTFAGQIRKFFGGISETLSPIIKTVTNFGKEVWNAVTNLITGDIKELGPDTGKKSLTNHLRTFFASIKKIFGEISKTLSPIIKTVTNFTKEVWNAVTNLITGDNKELGPATGKKTLTEHLRSFFDSVKKIFGPITASIGDFIKKIPGFFQGVGVFVSGLFTYLKDNIKLKEWAANLGTTLKPIVDRIVNFGKTIWNAVVNFFGGNKDKKLGKQKPFVETLKEKFATPEGVKEYFDNLIKTITKWFTDFKAKIAQKWEDVKKGVSDFFGGSKEKTTNEKADGLTRMFDHIKNAFQVVSDFVKGNWGWIAGAAALVMIIKFVKFAAEMWRIFGLYLQLKLNKDGGPALPKKDTIGTTFLKIAGSIALVAGAIYILSTLDERRMWQSVGIVAAVAAVIVAINVFGSKMKVGSGIGMGMAGTAAAIFIVVYSIKAIMDILDNLENPWGLVGAVLGVGVILMMLTKMSKNLNGTTFSGNWKTIIAMAASVWIIVQALKPLAKYSWEQLGKMGAGIIVLGLVLKSMVKSTNVGVEGGGKVKGFLAMAVGIWILIKALRPLVKYSWKQLGKMAVGLVFLSLVMKSMATAAQTKPGGKGNVLVFLAMAGSMWLILEALKPFGKMSRGEIENIAIAMLGMSAILVSFSTVAKQLSAFSSVKQIISILISMGTLAGVMWVFAYSLNQIGDVDSDRIIAFSGGLSAILISFGTFTSLIAGAGLKGVALAILTLAGVAALVSWAATNEDIANFLSGGAAFLGQLVGTFLGNMEVSRFQALQTGLSDLAAIEYDETGVDNSLTIANKIADFSKQLPARDVLTTITESIFGSDFGQFSIDTKTFGDAMNSFATNISSVQFNPLLFAKTLGAIAIAKQIQLFAAGLPPKGPVEQILDSIFGSELGQLSTDMVEFAAGINGFATQMNSVFISPFLSIKTTAAISIAKQIQTFAEGLPDKGPIEQLVDTIFNSPLEQLSEDMKAFAEGINGFATQMNAVVISPFLPLKTAAAVNIAKQISALETGLPEKGLYEKLKNRLFGSELKNLSDDMPEFAAGINGYATQMNAIAISPFLPLKTMAAVNIAKQVSNLESGLPEKGLFDKLKNRLFGSELKTLSDDMPTFASSIGSLTTAFNSVIFDESFEGKVTTAIGVASSIAALIASVNVPGVTLDSRNFFEKLFGVDSETDSLFDGLVRFASGAKTLDTELTGLDADTLETRVAAARLAVAQIAGLLQYLSKPEVQISDKEFLGWDSIDIVLAKMQNVGQKIKEFYENTATVDSTKFSNLIGPVSDFSVALATLSDVKNNTSGAENVTAAISTLTSMFKELGTLYATEMGAGIQDGQPIISEKWVGIMEALKTLLEPQSQTFKTLGEQLINGFVTGINSGKHRVTEAIRQMARAAVLAAQQELVIKSPSREFQDIAYYTVEGFTSGIDKNLKSVVKTTNQMARAAINTANGYVVRNPINIDPLLNAFGDSGNGLLGTITNMTSKIGDLFSKTPEQLLDELTNSMLGKQTDGISAVNDDKVSGSGSTTSKKGSGGGSGGNMAPSQQAAVQQLCGTVGQGLSQNQQAELLAQKLDELGKSVTHMKIVMDTGVVVGQIAPGVDNYLGTTAANQGRR